MLPGVCTKRIVRICLDWNVHVISCSQYQRPRGRPDTMYFLPNLYDRQSYAIEVDNIEIDEFYPSVTVDLSHNSFSQGVLN